MYETYLDPESSRTDTEHGMRCEDLTDILLSLLVAQYSVLLHYTGSGQQKFGQNRDVLGF